MRHNDLRHKPYVIVFDDGSSDSLDQEQAVQWRILAQGMRVVHPRRGRGVISAVDRADPMGRPLCVKFDIGNAHKYAAAPIPPRRRSSHSAGRA